MSTDQTWQISSGSSEDTQHLGEQIGKSLRGGEVIVLVSDLGGGKTTFVRGLAKGIGSPDTVRSPSFTISNEYTSPNLKIHHFDFYRLNDPGVIKEELKEVIAEPGAITIIEWADIVDDALPADHITVTIRATGEFERQLKFSYSKEKSYTIKNIT